MVSRNKVSASWSSGLESALMIAVLLLPGLLLGLIGQRALIVWFQVR